MFVACPAATSTWIVCPSAALPLTATAMAAAVPATNRPTARVAGLAITTSLLL
ncbi:MAG TPA: hypothetical protein VMP12_08555 [Candidatus Sulfotelmatobacter sp.]|nr:hypothetical protein [Candidatus Sulfotelmatobacter sp.]